MTFWKIELESTVTELCDEFRDQDVISAGSWRWAEGEVDISTIFFLERK